MVGRHNVLRLLNTPTGFYRRVSKQISVCQISAGIWALPDSAHGYTRIPVAGNRSSIPMIAMAAMATMVVEMHGLKGEAPRLNRSGTAVSVTTGMHQPSWKVKVMVKIK